MNGEMPGRFSHRLAFIIPTRNRVTLLKKLLATIHDQSVRPAQIIIVDGSDSPIKSQIAEFLRPQDTYRHVTPPSLTRQRNEGTACLDSSITLAGFLDDDMELDPVAVEEMLRFWETCPDDTGGVEFNIINNPPRNPVGRILTRLFLIDSNTPGKVLPSGFVTGEVPMKKTYPSEWLCGGATIWKTEIIKNNRFDEWYAGWAYYEDVEFSYRISKKYRMAVLYEARITHNPPPYNPEKYTSLGKMAVINRYHFVKKNPEFSIVCFYWSTLGEILLNSLRSVLEKNKNGLRIAKGNILGVYHIFCNNLIQLDENFRK